MVISEDIYVMLLTHVKFKEFTPKAICDSTKSTEVLICLSSESRDNVDDTVRKAVAAANDPCSVQDYGFMYQHGFQDLDGHIWNSSTWNPVRQKRLKRKFSIVHGLMIQEIFLSITLHAWRLETSEAIKVGRPMWKKWVGRERSSDPGSIAVISVVHYLYLFPVRMSVTRELVSRAYFLPIILAAWWFGFRGGV